MLYEDDIVEAVCSYLERHGWVIVSRALAHQHGDDVVASKGGVTLRVEAKGEGSSKARSAKYGGTFSSGQVHDHVAKAVFRAMAWWSTGKGDQRLAVAFPDNPHHRQRVESVGDALRRLDIGTFWVRQDKSVSLDAPWTV